MKWKLKKFWPRGRQVRKAVCAIVMTYLPRTCLSKLEHDMGPGFDGDETCTIQVIQHGVRPESLAATCLLVATMSFYLGWKCGKPAHNEKNKKEKNSVDTQSEKTDRQSIKGQKTDQQNVLMFGKFHGRTYEDIFQKEFGYCRWAMAHSSPASNPSPLLRHFAEWSRQRLELHQTHEAVNPEESDEDYSPEEDFDGLCSKKKDPTNSTRKSNQYNKRGPVC